MLAFVSASWYVAGALVAPAHRVVGPPPSGFPAESLTITSSSGSTLAGWFIPCDNATATIILLHSIRSDRRAMLSRAELLHDAGYATLLIDFQAHGESPGENVTAGHRERLDVLAAAEFARNKNPSHKIGVVGWSLGGAAALLASPLQIDALVLESVYPTIAEAVHNRVSMRLGVFGQIFAPALLIQLGPRLGIWPSQLCPIDHIQDAGCPVLLAAGDRDVHTTMAETLRLYQRAIEPKQLVVFENVAHSDLLACDRDKYEMVVSFLDEHLKPGGPEP